MIWWRWLITLLIGGWIMTHALAAEEMRLTLDEYLGYGWQADLVHRTVDFRGEGDFFPDRMALYNEAQQPVPCQLENVQRWKTGALQQADVWFRADLPARGTRTFILKSSAEKTPPQQTDLTLTQQGNVYLLTNAHTAVRLPAGSWDAPANATNLEIAAALRRHLGLPGLMDMPGPLLGVKLPTGTWTATSRLLPPADIRYTPLAGLVQNLPDTPAIRQCRGYASEVLANGPLFTRVRITYRFADGGQYSTTVTLRSGEPLVRLSEEYQKAGSLAIDLGAGFTPTAAVYETNSPSPNGRSIPITYTRPTEVGFFVGWDFFLAGLAPAFAFTGDPNGTLLGVVSTDPDWLPFPYNQGMLITSGPGKFGLRASLAQGHRHWGLYVGKSTDFAHPVKDYYRWWMHRVAFPLDKVANWQLAWPGMEEIAFPHTFFDAKDLPAIRARLQDEPTIKTFMEGRKVSNSSDAAAAYLYSGDAKSLDALATTQSPLTYLDTVLKMFLQESGYFTEHMFNPMQVTDEFLQRLIGLELLLGSERVTAAQRKEILAKLAYVVYLMHDPAWIPPNYSYDPQKTDPYPGYVQGTPNQKHCYYSVRAMTACVLANHPEKEKWLQYALEENQRVMPGAVAPSGVHLESPFYSSRDTMRFGPFWTALTRAGVQGPVVDEWFRREKMTYQYMGDMLTPPEPRMGGRRVYHPIGRSSSGVVDPTFMIGGEPWGRDDPDHRRLMRWLWEEQGKPSPDIMGTTGGRDLAQTLLAFSTLPRESGFATPPLRSKRWEGFGAIFRSQVGSGYESNVVLRQDEFAWNLYEANNGAVYFYGKGAPLLPRFGGYWQQQAGQPHLMSIPFGNRLLFASGQPKAEWLNGLGTMTAFASLGQQADYAVSKTRDAQWVRQVLFAKDLDREDPVYLLVRDDTSRPGDTTALHWWVLSKAVQPEGYEKPGVVPTKGSDETWLANLGKNWKDAPKLQGQLQRFEGQCGVDLDLFIAQPTDPVIVTDAVGVGPSEPYCVNRNLYEYQQLVRIEQPAEKSYLSLFVPRWPGGAAPSYRTIANGDGVAITRAQGEDRLFLGKEKVVYSDTLVRIEAKAGYARQGGAVPWRLMVSGGRITAGGISLTCTSQAALIFDGKAITVYQPKGGDARVALAGKVRGVKVRVAEE